MFNSLKDYIDQSLAIQLLNRTLSKYEKSSLSYVEKEEKIFNDFINGINAVGIKMPNDNEIKDAIHKLLFTKVDPVIGCYDLNKYHPWLNDAKANINWKHKTKYFEFLMAKGWPLDTIKSIDEYTDDILDHINNPKVDFNFTNKGLVIGDVQSGKTANYTGLIHKAIDSGYKLVIVLAGTLNSLRTQTQARMDSDLLGYESGGYDGSSEDGKLKIGFDDCNYIDIDTFTDKVHDWNSKTINKIMDDNMPPTIAIIKKRTNSLENTFKAITNNPKSVDGKINIPVLIIDDEVDQASINTKKHPDEDPATINGLIRKIIMSCNKVSYVGYTATPYANILINPAVENESFGKDLFPENFIIVLPTPKEYCGIEKFFGTRENPNYDLVVTIDDDSDFFDDKNNEIKKNIGVDYLPDSAKNAIDDFIIASAVRRSREGTSIHNSMMFNISGYQKGSKSLKELVEKHVSKIKYMPKNDEFYNYYFNVWNNRFKFISSKRGRIDNWDLIKEQILYVINALDVLLLNGESKDFLNYTKTGQHEVIAVGGNKLSRGITLEGLIVSYYLRKPHAYDTALQMGRWFGYKGKYFDLCRIYTKEDTLEDFITIFDATEELKEDIMVMNSRNLTPMEFQLKIQTHPSFKPTSRNKMYSANIVKVGFSEQRQETIRFDDSKFVYNKDLTNKFIKEIEDKLVEEDNHTLIYKNIESKTVLNYLNNYAFSLDDPRALHEQWIQYINNLNKDGELTNWTIVVDSLDEPNGDNTIELNGHILVKGFRSKPASYSYVRAISKPSDFKYYFDKDSEDRKKYRNGYKKGDEYLRKVFSKDQCLLTIYPIDIVDKENQQIILNKDVIGFAIWFPYTQNISGEAEYAINMIEELEIDEDEDGDLNE